MKTQKIGMGLLVMLIAVMTACAPAPTPVPPTATPAPTQAALDPIAVAKQYVAILNAGDFDKAFAFYADDAIANTPIGVFIGKAQIAKWLESDIQTTRPNPREWKMQGALVVNTGAVSLDRFTKAGMASVEYRTEYLVDKNGKIRFFNPVVMLTPEQQQKMREAQASAPPGPTPAINPIEVVKAYIETSNTGDFDKALAFYADDSGAFVVNGTLLLSGKTQVADWLKDDIQTTRAKLIDVQANGNLVIVTGTVSLDRFKKLGIDAVAYRAQYVVEKGKIRFFYPTLQFTPDQAAKVQAAQPSSAMPSK